MAFQHLCPTHPRSAPTSCELSATVSKILVRPNTSDYDDFIKTRSPNGAVHSPPCASSRQLAFNSNKEFFERILTAFPNHLLTIPDGETGKRNYFVRWQFDIFAESPYVLKNFQEVRDYKVCKTDTALTHGIKMSAPGYNDFAIDSYAEFCRLREEGVIQQGVRFQVSLPTPVNVVGL